MKKLQKRVLFSKDTIEAFACPCSCGCSCTCTTDIYSDQKSYISSENSSYKRLENMYEQIEP